VPLQALETPPLSGGRARNGKQLPRRQGCRDGYASVNADNLARPRPWNGWRDRCGRDVPGASTVPGHPVGLGVGNWARPAEPDPAELGDQHLAPAAAEAARVPRPHGDDAEPFVHVALTPGRRGGRRWALLRRELGGSATPLGQCGIPACPCGVEVPKSLLLHDHAALRQPRGRDACFGELPALLGKSWCWLAWLPPRALLHRQIPHEPGVGAVLQERHRLGGCRIQAVAAHGRTVASTCDDDGKGGGLPSAPKGMLSRRRSYGEMEGFGQPREIPR
jgi:hypothetical protein